MKSEPGSATRKKATLWSRRTLALIRERGSSGGSASASLRLEGKGSFVGVRQHRRKDGSLLDVEVSASTILLGGRGAICAVAHDVTERAQAQRLLEKRLAILPHVASRLTLGLPVQESLDAVAEGVVNASTAVFCR